MSLSPNLELIFLLPFDYLQEPILQKRIVIITTIQSLYLKMVLFIFECTVTQYLISNGSYCYVTNILVL